MTRALPSQGCAEKVEACARLEGKGRPRPWVLRAEDHVGPTFSIPLIISRDAEVGEPVAVQLPEPGRVDAEVPRLVLTGVSPLIWHRLQLSSATTIYELHDVLQATIQGFVSICATP